MQSHKSKFKIFQFLRQYFFALVLVFIVVVIATVNYQPGTILSGWDTLHPEFNPIVYLKRLFFGVWQEHQGLGAVASQAHPAELPRMVLYFILAALFSPDQLRYVYMFVCLLMGVLGVYFLIERSGRATARPYSLSAIAFCGALVYLFNLGTLQHFYLPFEMFATHYATLPWLIFFGKEFIQKGKPKILLFFAIVTLFATAIAHTATLFYVFFGVFSLYLLILGAKSGIKRAAVLIVLTLFLNSFWLLPNLYFVLDHGVDVERSKIHTQFSDRAFATGKKFGDLGNTLRLKNFLFDWGELDKDKGEFVPLFDEWMSHLEAPEVQLIWWLVVGVVLAGLVARIRSRDRFSIALLPFFIIPLLFIANNTSLSKPVFVLLDRFVPLFREAMRFPFTKFSTMLMLSYAVYFGYGIEAIIANFPPARNNKLRTYSTNNTLAIFVSVVTLGLLSYFCLPFYTGNLVSPSMKVVIPQTYFDMFDWFRRQDHSGRIATFPIHTFWGWQYYRWHYEGAGFLWFGLEQPLMDREFDRWMPSNENYYWEMTNAVYADDTAAIERVLAKYNIRYLLVDHSIINPYAPVALYYPELTDMFSKMRSLTRAQTFGDVVVYEVNLAHQPKQFVNVTFNLPQVGPPYAFTNHDQALLKEAHYIAENPFFPYTQKSQYFPFRTLFTGRRQDERAFSLAQNEAEMVFASYIPSEAEGARLLIDPSLVQPFFKIARISDPITILVDGEIVAQLTPRTKKPISVTLGEMQKGIIEVHVPKVPGAYAYNSDQTGELFTNEAHNCDTVHTDLFTNEVRQEKRKFLRMTAKSATNCLTIYPTELTHDLSYLTTVTTRNVDGKSFLFWIEDMQSRYIPIETYLESNKDWHDEFFVLSPHRKGEGYTVQLWNTSIGVDRAVNDVASVSMYPIPYDLLTSLVVTGESPVEPLSRGEVAFDASHPNSSFYEVTLQAPRMGLVDGVLTLSQAYDWGWKAYEVHNPKFKLRAFLSRTLPFLYGKEIREHALMDGWANGWKLNNFRCQTTNEKCFVIIVFLPQYLEYFGFILSGLAFAYVVKKQTLPGVSIRLVKGKLPAFGIPPFPVRVKEA